MESIGLRGPMGEVGLTSFIPLNRVADSSCTAREIIIRVPNLVFNCNNCSSIRRSYAIPSKPH